MTEKKKGHGTVRGREGLPCSHLKPHAANRTKPKNGKQKIQEKEFGRRGKNDDSLSESNEIWEGIRARKEKVGRTKEK